MPAVLGSTPPPSNSHNRVSSFETMDPVGERNSSDHGGTGRAGLRSSRKRLHSLTSRTKTKAKTLLKRETGHDLDEEGPPHDESVSEQIDANPAFNPSKAVKKDRASAGGAGGKALETLQTVVETLAHPIDTVKSKATRATAGQLSEVERPKPSQESDAKLLQAQLDLSQVQSSSSSRLDSHGNEQHRLEDELRQKVEDIEAHRHSLRVAWVTSRHVDRVRVVPTRYIDFPNGEAYRERDLQGNVIRYEWIKWLGCVSLESLAYGGMRELMRGCLLVTALLYTRFQCSVY